MAAFTYIQPIDYQILLALHHTICNISPGFTTVSGFHGSKSARFGLNISQSVAWIFEYPVRITQT